VYYDTHDTADESDDTALAGAPIDAGSYKVVSTYDGDANHDGSSDTDFFAIAKANQVITWSNPAPVAFGTVLSATQLNATVAGVPGGSAPGALTYTPPAGTQLLTLGSNALSVTAAATNNYNQATKTVYINVVQREGIAAYIGQTTVFTSGASSTTAQVALTASIKDTSGAGFSLVGYSTVTFTDVLTGKVLASGVKVSPVGGDPTMGVANTFVTLSSGKYGSNSYLVKVTLGSAYNNDQQLNDPALQAQAYATITVLQPSATNSMKGAGTLTMSPYTTGTYRGSGNATYSFGLSYSNGGRNPQGQVLLIIPQADGSTVYIKSNSITSVSINSTTKTATVFTKASVYKVLANGSIVSLDGNVSLKLDVKDGGTSASDQVGFTVLSSKDSTLYYSNYWAYEALSKSWKTIRQTVSGASAVVIG
jgi:hypothetical protein